LKVSFQPIQVAVIGDFHRNDFQNFVRDIRGKTAAIYFDNLALFLQTNGLGQRYDLLFLLAYGCAQYSPSDIQQLQNRLLNTRIVLIAGSLTEGERRTGMLPPDMIRCYWHQWETEVQPVFTSFCDRRYSAWGLPLTASEEERLLAIATTIEKTRYQSKNSPLQTAVIVADDAEMQALLLDWTMQKGYHAEAHRWVDFKFISEIIATSEILFDVISEDFAETLAIVQLLKKRSLSSTRLTVFYNSPRPDEFQQLTQAGATRIVSKPFFLP